MECCFWFAENCQGVQEFVIFCLNACGLAWKDGPKQEGLLHSNIYIYRSEQKYSYGLGFLLRAVLLTVWNVKKTSCSHRATCCAFLNRRMFVLSRFLHFVHMAQLHLTLSIFIECCRIQNMNGMERQSVGVNEYAFSGS